MKIFRYPQKESWTKLLLRPAMDLRVLEETVGQVLREVRDRGDVALMEYTRRFDHVMIENPQVSEEEFLRAGQQIDQDLKSAVSLAIRNIRKFHEAQIPGRITVETMPGVECWQKPVPIQKVGLYVPGGTAPLFSTVLMLAVPAVIAGCREIILCTPPGKEGGIHAAILYAAREAGVQRVFKAGGAQAIAAMAYGTATIPKVNKILGPGNQYVTAAKQLASREEVAIDLPAGPSELAVLADDTSNPAFVASDLLSQAEHGEDSQVILITTSERLLEQLEDELKRQLDTLPRKDFAFRSLQNSKAFLVEGYDEMMDMVNDYAPEHLIISTGNAEDLAERVENAGSVFLGNYTPESAGDYASGTNHTLPTNGYAKAYSGVNLDAYYKKITFQKISREGLMEIGQAVEKMALTEDLTAHQRAVAIRLNTST